MKRSDFLILLISVFAVAAFSEHKASAQEIVVPEGYELVDSVVFRHVSGVDTLLAGRDVFHVMPLKAKGDNADVEIYQSQEVAAALRKQTVRRCVIWIIKSWWQKRYRKN